MHFSLATTALFLGVAAAGPTPHKTGILGKRFNGQLPKSYLALGDSFAAGIGAGPFTKISNDASDNECGRTTGSYPYTLTNGFHPSAFDPTMPQWKDFQACSGDKLGNIPGQLDAVRTKKFDVVTLSIVGNDFFFGEVAKQCIYKFGTKNEAASQEECDVHLDRVDELLRRQVDDDVIWTEYADIIRRIQRDNLAENGIILLTGYAQFFSPNAQPGDLCETLRTKWKILNSKVPLHRDNRNRMNDQVKQVNERISDDVLGNLGHPANVKFVDIDPLYEHNRFCEPFVPDPLGSNNNAVWFTELNTTPLTTETFSPRPSLGDSLNWEFSIPGVTPSALQKASTFHPKPPANKKVAEVLTYEIIKWHAPQ